MNEWVPVRVYTDGGVIKRNPSVIGGTWAYVQTDERDQDVFEASGFVTPEQIGKPDVSNNVTELLAVLEAMEALPKGWAGEILTDSMVTLRRVRRTRKQAQLHGVPESMRLRLARCKRRLGGYTVSLLGGHPNKKEVAAGLRKDGRPCSRHNVRCDDLCRLESEKFLANFSREKRGVA